MNTSLAARKNNGGTVDTGRAIEKVSVVENTDKAWTTKYAHQKRPDHDLRMKNAMPYHKMVKSSRPAFTTESPK